MGIADCQVGVHVFEVGQVDVDIWGQQLQGLHGVVATGVVDCRGEEAPLMETFYDGGNVVSIMRRGDKADDVLGLGQCLGDSFYDGVDTTIADGSVGMCRKGADIVVLTVDALEVTVGKEDITDAFFATEGRLFALVNTDGDHFGFGGSSTESDSCNAVDLTGPRTEFTIHFMQKYYFFYIQKTYSPTSFEQQKVNSEVDIAVDIMEWMK